MTLKRGGAVKKASFPPKASPLRRVAAIMLAVGLLFSLAGCAEEPEYFTPFDNSALNAFADGKSVVPTEDTLALAAMKAADSNEKYCLLYNGATAEIAITTLDGAQVWRSNPDDRLKAGREKIASGQLLLTTSDSRDVTREWDSYNDAAAYGQSICEPIEGGLRVTYYFGQKQKAYLAPQAIPAERFEQDILPKVDSTVDSSFLRRTYGRIALSEIASIQTRTNLLERFPELENKDIYALKNTPSKLELQKTEEILTGIGYTPENMLEDQAACGYIDPASSTQHIKVMLEYLLNDDGFTVRVPVSEIETSPGLKVTELEVLRYFGTPADRQGSYAVLPHNSGAVIDFSAEVSPGMPAYSERVYGADYSRLEHDRTSQPPNLFLPVFGVVSRKAPFAAMIEHGAAIASIQADAPRAGSYAYASSRYLLLNSAMLSLDASPENKVPIYAQEAVTDDISIRYFLLNEDASYSDMANKLRQYGRESGGWNTLGQRSVPFLVETLGAIDVNRPIAGVPRQVTETLTSFSQSQDIAEWFGEATGTIPDILLNGWRKGGLRSGVANHYDPESKLGGQNGLASLNEFCTNAGSKLYLAADFPYVYRDSWFDGFSIDGDTAKLVTSDVGLKPDYCASTYFMEKGGLSAYMLRPEFMLRNAQTMGEQMSQAGMTGIALPSLGRDLYSDYSNTAVVNRNEMQAMVSSLVSGLKAKEFQVASKGMNGYLAPNVDVCYDLPLIAPAHPVLTGEIPLLQMIYSGCVAYTGSPVNYSQDAQTFLLKSIETGSGLYAKLFAEPGAAVKDTDFDFLFSEGFNENRETVAMVYREIVTVLSPVYGFSILEHSKSNGISKSVYENGYAVYVNYTNAAVECDGVEIPARGWRTVDCKGDE